MGEQRGPAGLQQTLGSKCTMTTRERWLYTSRCRGHSSDRCPARSRRSVETRKKSVSLCVSRGVCTRTSGVKGQRRVMLGAARIRAVCLPHVAMMSAEHNAPIPSRIAYHTQLEASFRDQKFNHAAHADTAIQRASCTHMSSLSARYTRGQACLSNKCVAKRKQLLTLRYPQTACTRAPVLWHRASS